MQDVNDYIEAWVQAIYFKRRTLDQCPEQIKERVKNRLIEAGILNDDLTH